MCLPKNIHYCWFGRKPLPKLALKCINSWRKFLPEFQITEWNEDNFDVNIIPYTAEAYKRGKFAFVSDFARFWILYNQGGLYFDTDVEIIKSMDDIIENGPFIGIENDNQRIYIAPGLGMGAYSKMIFYKEIISIYEKYNPQDLIEPLLIKETTDLFVSKGFKLIDKIQKIDDITIYPNEYFNPKDDYTGKIHITDNTRAIHHFAKSWVENYGPLRNSLTQFYHRLLLRF